MLKHVSAARAGVPSALILLCAVLAGCGDSRDAGGPLISREVVGDTTVVRIAGEPESVFDAVIELQIGELEGPQEYTFGRVDGIAVAGDGSIYVLDNQALEIRVFDETGRHVRTFARSGEGPGELKQPSGMLFLPDGRLAVRDPGNARVNLYSAAGASVGSFPIPGGFFTSAPIFADRQGRLYTDIVAERYDDGRIRTGLLRLTSDGTVVDTIPRPFPDYNPPALVAERTSGTSRARTMNNVPFWPQAFSTLNRNGELIGGIADRYMFQLWRQDGSVLRVEREVPPVAVAAGESATEVERTTRSMRQLDESWRWDGPRPPATKPAYTDLRTGEDDMIWVRISQPAQQQPPDPDEGPDARGNRPLDRWTTPMVYEAFSPDGEFVARVRFPERFRPVLFRSEHVYGVLRDEYDVQYVTRLRVLPPDLAPVNR